MPATYEIHTDGSCLLNPGPGGWGAVIAGEGGATSKLSGGERSTTNNRMEIVAVIEALESIPQGASAVVHSDSEYVVKTMTKGWKRNANKDLWERLERAAAARNVEFRWVRGHAGNKGNEMADRLAVNAMKDIERGKIPSGGRSVENAPPPHQAAASPPPAPSPNRREPDSAPRPSTPANSASHTRLREPDSAPRPAPGRTSAPPANSTPPSAPSANAASEGDGAALTHIDAQGSARMVDVGGKPYSARMATATGEISMRPATLALILDGQIPKGDVFTVARIAGINAAKRAWETIPLAHQIPLSSVSVDFDADAPRGRLAITAEARTTAQTGVEMEALTAVLAAALTVYDMCKAVDLEMVIGNARLIRKTGGTRGDYEAQG